ncbi:ATP-binding protein [Sorangium sp. So ce854]|uniref:ATP-binding protein n=1 Tax=Sorangium sp. So ce854 TaxID=3133322 RepID=UPI003F5E470E
MKSENRSRILVVEDEQIVALDLRGRLTQLGYEVVATAATGAAAIARAAELHPDLVLMDIKLSGPMDGIEAAEKIQQIRETPVVYLTAFGDDVTLTRAKARELYGYVLKPFDERELQIAIEVALFRHRTAQQLAEREAWLAAVLGGVSDGVVASDAAGRVRLMNGVAEALSGWRAEDASGRDLGDVLRLAPAERAGGPAWAAIPHRVLTRRDGATLPVEAHERVIHGDKGHGDKGHGDKGAPLGRVWVLRDVTEPLQILESQRAVMEASAELPAVLDDPQALERVARRLVPALGEACIVHLAEASGPLEVEVVACAEHERAADLCAALRQARGGGLPEVARRGEAVLRALPDPEALAEALGAVPSPAITAIGARWLVSAPLPARGRTLGALTLVTSRPGRCHGARDLALAQDLGRRVAMAIDNARLYRDAQRAIHLRDDALAIVSHDLRNPLSAVIAGAEALRRDATDRVRNLAGTIQRAGRGMERLISDLLDAARLDDGHLAVESSACAARSLIADALEAFELQIAAKELSLSSDVRGDAEALCDRARIGQVLSNLIGNAVKFTPRGGSIGVRVQADGGHVLFAVSDSGPGIPPEQIPHLFERFWQGTAAARQGTGLGLYIARGIVDLHGGRIWAESSPGHGSTFLFTLPRAPPAGAREEA